MQRKNIPLKAAAILLLLLTCLTHTFAQSVPTISYGNNKEAGHYATVNGIQMYYEVYGEGKPLVLLHGNGGSISGHKYRIEYFKKYFKVIAIDSRAQGKSIDTVIKSLTYDLMAKDLNDLLESIHVDSAYVWGQSDGGILGLLLAIHYPKKTAKVAVFGANIYPGRKAVYDEIDQMVIDTLKSTKTANTRLLYSMMDKEPHISRADLKKITAPVLVMSGDRDAIRLEHTLEIFQGITNSNLFIMPGATHFGSRQKPELFNTVLMEFFTQPFSKTSTMDMINGK